MALNQSVPDREVEAIRQTVLDYLESCYTWDGPRMRRALHPKLAKRNVWTNPKTGRSKMFEYSAPLLIRDTQGGWGDRKAGVKRTPIDQCQRDILMIDRFNDMGIAKTEAIWGIDYIQLAKFNGTWKIINVLWQTKDGQQGQKEDRI